MIHAMVRFSRLFSSNPVKRVKFSYIGADKKEIQVEAPLGKNLLEVAHQNDVDLEGACEGSLACSTCHIILEDRIYESLAEPTADEEDMLDLAYGLTPTSRLGCQVKVTEQMEGAKVRLPEATRNMYVDGHKPKPH